MRVEFTSEAEQHVGEIDAWWREERRDAPDLFAGELAEVLTFAAAMPSASVAYSSGGREYRRVLLPRTRHHVYFRIDAERSALVVHAVWGGPRGRGPALP